MEVGAPPVLDVRDVYRIYRSGAGVRGVPVVETVALRGSSLTILAGEFVALLGPSGSGKSTLMQLAVGLDEPSAGQVLLSGQSLLGMDEDSRSRLRARRVGIVFQRDNLWPQLSALENAALPAMLAGLARDEAHRRALALLRELGLGERTSHRPDVLSGGEQQRVALAMALINQPALLVADEPTGELDAANEARVLDLFDEVRRRHGCALLVVTHSRPVADRADRVVRIRDGVCEAA